MDSITQHNTAVLCATHNWLPQDVGVLETVRAAASFHGRPAYDSVLVDMEGMAPCYAQLRLIFEFNGLSLALIRWYQEIPAHRVRGGDRLSTRHAVDGGRSCTLLEWEGVRAPRNAAGGAASVQQPVQAAAEPAHYQVVGLDAIMRRLYIVPDFAAPAQQPRFHVSFSKWWRRPAALYSAAEPAGVPAAAARDDDQ